MLEGLIGRDLIIVHGACHLGGVDLVAHEWTDRTPGVAVEPYPAADFGAWPSCGPRRNSHMVSLGADLCFAFPELRADSRRSGTWDCAMKANAAGIPVRLLTLPPEAS